jgi:hypothetical protein
MRRVCVCGVTTQSNCGMLHTDLAVQERPDAAYTLTEAQMLPGGCGDTDPEVRVRDRE